MGGYVSKGGRFCKRHPKEWGAKNSEAQKRRWASTNPADLASCPECNGLFYRRVSTQRTCGANECRYGRHKGSDPVESKAVTLAGSVRLGAGKKDFMVSLLRAALDKPCVYCSSIVTLKNASLDHIVPFGGLRGKPLGKHLDNRDNLQIICRRCNRGKGNLSDRGFRKLLAFLRTDPEISAYVWKRIAGAGVQFMAYRAAQRRRSA